MMRREESEDTGGVYRGEGGRVGGAEEWRGQSDPLTHQPLLMTLPGGWYVVKGGGGIVDVYRALSWR